jgi:hypothetical protein
MTDPTPNNPVPTPLSPAAQAVLDAVVSHPSFATRKRIAAAICATADQLINLQRSVEMWELHQKFHSIATKLENHQ